VWALHNFACGEPVASRPFRGGCDMLDADSRFVAVVFKPPLQEGAMTEYVPLIFSTAGMRAVFLFFAMPEF
jgi:hypothetical protein